jgi:transposase
MQTSHILGVDISKLSFDVCCHNTGQGTSFPNNKKGFAAFDKWLAAQLPSGCLNGSTFLKPLTVLEHTGHYSFGLERHLEQKALPFHKHSGLDIRRSMGILRGKTDAADARTIARFAYQRREELQPTTPKSASEVKLAQLCSTRAQLVTERAAHSVRLKEMKASMGKELCPEVQAMTAAVISCLDKQIIIADKAIAALIKEDEALRKNNELVRSVKGIGPVTAAALLLYTRNFSVFPDWRHFASWAGVAPFAYQSGTSISGKTKVSHLANKKMKALLQSAACIAIVHDPELKDYYKRKLAEGKPKMKVFNAVRCKLLARVFAVVKRHTHFQPINPKQS